MSKKPSVIIVGAGVAGIAAATKLLENSITNVTILEAEDRIGGRIRTVDFGNGVMDIGAQFCHGESGNAVYELAKNFNVLEHSQLFGPETQKLYSSDGEWVKGEVAEDVKTAVANYQYGINTSEGVNLKDAFLEKYNSTILAKYKNDEGKLNLLKDAINLIHHTTLISKAAANWEYVAAGIHFQYSEGDFLMTLKKGYSVIFDILMKSYPHPDQKLPIDDKIFLNKKVTKIIWKESVTVKTSDGSSYTADHVIFTPSVGVLKIHADSIFEPVLPSEKKAAIDAIGFAGIMKIVLRFPKPWWQSEDSFLFLWKKENFKKISEEFREGPHKNGISWVSDISGLTRASTSSNILIAWVTGDLVKEIEQAPEDVVMRGSMYVIRKFLGKDYNITDPDKILRSQWNTDPNFLGTYCYEKAEHYKESVSHNGNLAEPLVNGKGKPVLLFAGEATNPTHYSTVHGAIESGRREAERILELCK